MRWGGVLVGLSTGPNFLSLPVKKLYLNLNRRISSFKSLLGHKKSPSKSQKAISAKIASKFPLLALFFRTFDMRFKDERCVGSSDVPQASWMLKIFFLDKKTTFYLGAGMIWWKSYLSRQPYCWCIGNTNLVRYTQKPLPVGVYPYR